MNERPQPRLIKKMSFLDKIKHSFKKARDFMAPLFNAAGDTTPTRNEMRLDANEWTVKQKLGKSYFTKRLNENTRVARVSSLTHDEWNLAKARGWVR